MPNPSTPDKNNPSDTTNPPHRESEAPRPSGRHSSRDRSESASRYANAAGFSNRFGEHLDENEQHALHEASSGDSDFSRARSNVEDIASDLRNRANDMASDFSSHANQYYDEATDWLNENSGKALMAVGLIAAVGVAGLMIVRSGRRDEWDSRSA